MKLQYNTTPKFSHTYLVFFGNRIYFFLFLYTYTRSESEDKSYSLLVSQEKEMHLVTTDSVQFPT